MTLLTYDARSIEDRLTDLEHHRAVWNDERLEAWKYLGGINAPYQYPIAIGPSSIDLRIDNVIRRPRWYWRNRLTRWLTWQFMARRRRDMKDQRNEDFYWKFEALEKTVLWPGDFVIISTIEQVTIPDDALGLIKLRSTPARMGLNHALAGVLDPGFGKKRQGGSTITLEFCVPGPFPLEFVSGKSYVQLIMFDLCAPANKPYDGRYAHQGHEPVPPRQEKS